MMNILIVGLFAAAIQSASTEAAPDFDPIVKADLESVLRDVETTRIRQVREPRWATVREDAWTTATGWTACYSINAQNAYGGYTGAKTWLFVVEKGAVKMRIVGGRSSWFDSVIERECSQPTAG